MVLLVFVWCFVLLDAIAFNSVDRCFFAGLFAGLCLFNGVVGIVACWGLGVLRYCAQVWTSV